MTDEQVKEVRKDFARGGRLTDLCASHDEQAATIARLERELAEARRVLAGSEKFRDAFEAAKSKMYAAGGEIAEFAFANMPCGSGPLDRAAAAVVGNQLFAKAEALDALAVWLQASTSRYVEYVAVDDAHGQTWRITLADCISFDGSGPTLPAAIMGALKKAGAL